MDSVWRLSGIVLTGTREIQAQSGLLPQGDPHERAQISTHGGVRGRGQTADHERTDPIEGLQITDKGVVVWAGGRAIRMTYGWNRSYAENGEPHLGGGH